MWVAVLAVVLCAGPASAKSTRLKASSHGGVVKVAVGKKTLTYYQATVLKPVEAVVVGPTRLRVIARNMAPEPGGDPVILKVEIDGGAPKTVTLKAASSKTASAPGGKAIGVLAKRSFEIPAGRHRVRVMPSEAGSAAAVRLYRGTAKKAKVEWVPFAPTKFEKALRLRSGDTELTCYRFTATAPVELSVIGPLRMRVDTRVDFGMTNGTTQSYVVKTLLDGKPWKSFSLKSRASHTTQYPEMAEVTPGRSVGIALEVPVGRHRVSVLLNGAGVGAATAAVRVVKGEVGGR
jgi:hypothetical protein